MPTEHDRTSLTWLDSEVLHAQTDRAFGPCLDPWCSSPAEPPTTAPEISYPAEVSLTRRTPRFAELTAAIEARLHSVGITLRPGLLDDLLSARIQAAANQLGVAAAEALDHAPDDVADSIARELFLDQYAQGSESAGSYRRLRAVPSTTQPDGSRPSS